MQYIFGRRQLRRKEEARKSAEIKTDIPAEKVVYIDKSGIEERVVKDREWGAKGQKIAKKRAVNITIEARLSQDM